MDLYFSTVSCFGLPILDAAPSVDYPCGPGDFNKVIRHYGFHKGISSMIESPEQRITLSGRICELNIVLKTRLNCILSEDESFWEAAEVGFALDELIEAMEIRLEYGLKNIY
ncbi:unnamed protein product [Lepeophtheirus salmonis]|uniref:(salmon louse) hypothetical protein n=1 Tax=Lepeophtheirus salmonis TaxID=72036 RepID=A0A7R8CV08_LEPSM|nr:unnamed protein product [Lepeophtheirus salmonis]CAF2941139.1 unnamed protein product [Lepeophtheirus salmonis]